MLARKTQKKTARKIRSGPKLVVSNPHPVKTLDLTKSVSVSEWDRIGQLYGSILIKGIKADPVLSKTLWFTRESLLSHFKDVSIFNRISTISRYVMICQGVTWLIQQGELCNAGMSRRNLCLAKNQKNVLKELGATRAPLYKHHYTTILGLVQTYPVGAFVTTIDIVYAWEGSDMTEDVRRILVRQSLHIMAKIGALRENDDYTYVILPRLHEEA